MHVRTLLLRLALAVLAVPALDMGAQSPERRFVAAMGPDSLALRGMQLSVYNAVRAGKEPLATWSCVERIPRRELTSIYVNAAATALTPEELAVSTTFFESPAGRKLFSMGLYGLQIARAGARPEHMPELSAEESDTLKAFGRTSAGQKLLLQQVLNAPDVRQALSARVLTLLRGCQDRARDSTTHQ